MLHITMDRFVERGDVELPARLGERSAAWL